MGESSSVTNRNRIPLFEGNNFNNWRFRVESALDERDLLVYIQSDINGLLTAAANNTEREKIRKEEKACKNIIVQSVHDCQLENIKGKSSAKEMIETLASIYERKSIASQLLLRRQLLTMKFDEVNDIADHFVEFDRRIRDLKSAGAKLEENDIVCNLLITLPEAYDNLVIAIETMDQTKVTLDFIKGRLLDEYNKRKPSSSSNAKVISSAMQTNITCFKCGQAGHKIAQCKSKKQQWKRNKGKKETTERDGANMAETSVSLCAVAGHVMTSFIDDAVDAGENAACKATVNESMQIKFVLDSGASEHMANCEKYFECLKVINPIGISVAKRDAVLYAKKRGDIHIKTYYNGDCDTKIIRDVLFVKDLKTNLLSIRSMTRHGIRVIFNDDFAYAMLEKKIIFVARAVNKLYEVNFSIEKGEFAGLTKAENKTISSQKFWHFRLAHLNMADIKKLVDGDMVNGIGGLKINLNERFCEPCIMGKQTKLPFPKCNSPRSNRMLQLIHSDVCGPITPQAYDGSKYFVTFIDDYSKASMVYCIKRKSEVIIKFKEYVAMAEALHNQKIACLKADNGGEYVSNEFKTFCHEKGIRLNYTVPYNPEMNSVAERLNRTLVERVRTMLIAGNVDKSFWSEAVLGANYIKNGSPTSSYGDQFLKKTPAGIWFGEKPDISNLRVFGAMCYNLVPAEKRTKLDEKSKKCIMMGYAGHKSYRLWDADSKKIIIGRNVIFDEGSILDAQKVFELSNSEADNNNENIVHAPRYQQGRYRSHQRNPRCKRGRHR